MKVLGVIQVMEILVTYAVAIGVPLLIQDSLDIAIPGVTAVAFVLATVFLGVLFVARLS